MTGERRERVLIAGDGIAGLESVLALQALAPGRFDITMLTPERHFIYRPIAVRAPFPAVPPARVELAAVARDREFSLVRDVLERIDPAAHEVTTQDGQRIAYDTVILAIGGRAVAAVKGAIPFRGARDAAAVTAALGALGDGPVRVAFIARSIAMWTAPIYELALTTALWAHDRGSAIEVVVVTAEARPLEVFGRDASDRVADLLRFAGVGLRSDTSAEKVAGGCLHTTTGVPLPVDLAIALPHLTGRAVQGLPRDTQEFIPVEDTGRVRGVADVYAVGDTTDRPWKQDSVAAQQADTAAAAIVGGSDPAPPYTPVLRAELRSRRTPLKLRRPPGANGAETFAGRHLASYLGTRGELQNTTGVRGNPVTPAGLSRC
ncbi:MAG: sulfide:quinone oxidoreductase [Solirubrobacteraceae bacterium]|nr:sulfide:quinone oxidoreductase [Solirubrobacteraceae bacterium]